MRNPWTCFPVFRRILTVICLTLFAILPSSCRLFQQTPAASSEPVPTVEPAPHPIVIPPEPDYANPSSWILQRDTEGERDFELFYIYPTLFTNPKRPIMDVRFERIRKKAVDYTELTMALVTGHGHRAAVFAPFIRQADFSSASKTDRSEPPENTLLKTGIEDTRTAFRYFMEHLHKPGVPVILLGHSQGAIDLYALLKSDRSISVENGFAAAYLAGLPEKTAAEIDRDFAGRDGLHRGTGETDIGAILVWNTQSKTAEDKMMLAVPGGSVINPMNWKTDTTPASGSVQPAAYFYDGEDSPIGQFDAAMLDGTYADPERGVVITDLPEDSPYDANALMGRGVFHTNDVFLFAESIRENMALRAEAWRSTHPKAE